MSCSIHFSPLAQQDLQEIQSYISLTLHNPMAAKSLIQKMKGVILSLRSFPEMGTSLKQDGHATIYRYLICNSYLIFYHVDDVDVKIDRILYGRRNYMALLFDELQEDIESS